MYHIGCALSLTVESSAPMLAQLPRPSAPPGAAARRSVFRSKIAIATQQQREQAFLLAQVDKSLEPAIDKTCVLSCAAPATPSWILTILTNESH